ncbi:chromosomal replication initiator DnaA [Sulfitobacter albidus]|uniref:Chromosomal replication initiator DnaA n=1 Tax=Sulfitobacter albidus TaxID=2829501 RepID=A0A975PMR0_9RHOB|nr:chromosomal replication initiator DnaA [Sulfitobacter albidus]QUJ77072.1 chromosomal replication initiator DnaA [Sulfitobacter albidus]
MAQQLGLDLPARTARGRDDFLVAPCNALAVSLIDGWEGWHPRKLVLSGPPGAGKTHLAHVWAERAGAVILDAADLVDADIPTLAQGAVAVEDIPRIATQAEAQTALFHLHNLTLASGGTLLLTGTGPAAHWALPLPDLQSRIAGTLEAQIDAPDDALLAALLVKLFADRQLFPPADVVPFLLPRIERSFAAARDTVAAIDAYGLATKRPLTRALASAALDKGTAPAR